MIARDLFSHWHITCHLKPFEKVVKLRRDNKTFVDYSQMKMKLKMKMKGGR